MQRQIELAKYSNCKTSHVFHLLLTILTDGTWGIIWIICAISNAIKRDNIEKNLNGHGN